MDNRFTEYHESGTLSDVTIKLQDRGIKAHKVVLAAGSPYFKACFHGVFQEANAATIELHEDNPEAMVLLIRYIYCHHLDETSRSEQQILGNLPEAYDYYEVLIELYVVASKYFVTSLCDEVQAQTRVLLRLMHRMIIEIDKLAGPIRRVFVTRADEADSFRKGLVELFTTKVTRVHGDEAYRKILATAPEFAVDVTDSFIEQKQIWRAHKCRVYE